MSGMPWSVTSLSEVFFFLVVGYQNKSQSVAVKTLKDDVDQHDRVMFLQEAAIMGQFRHKNIVRLFVVVTEEPTVGAVTSVYHCIYSGKIVRRCET